MRPFGCASVALLLFMSTHPASAQPALGLSAPEWKAYSDRAGTTVDYPAGIFGIDAGAAPRGEGRELRSGDGRARFMVYVEANQQRYTPSRFIQTQLAAPKSPIEYRRVTDRFFVISGIVGEQIYYSRCNFPSGAGGPIHCIYVAYPQREKRGWDPIVTRMSRSLRPR